MARGVRVPPRKGATKILSQGVNPGAIVCRGPDWDWGDQDGGEGRQGRVLEIRGWEGESGRSVACVRWANGTSNVYRMGHKGKVDLRVLHEAPGGHYYRDHFAILGEPLESPEGAFRVGDAVQILLDVEVLRAMQAGHGGWNPRMAECIGQVGIVHRVTERGDVRVQFPGCAHRWTVHPAALTRVKAFNVGDYVRVSSALEEVRQLQRGHGEWAEAMRNILGRVGRVLRVYADGDLRVQLAGHQWTLNPACAMRVAEPDELSNADSPKEHAETSEPLHALIERLALQPAFEGADRLVKAAAQGHLDIIREMLDACPDLVHAKSSGKSALQVAAHQGHAAVVEMLLARGADGETPDDEGDTALHYCAFGNQPAIMRMLLERGARFDATNHGGCSPLHVAVNKQHAQCVESLLAAGADCNTQDSFGDTPLHDALGRQSETIASMLVRADTIQPQRRNKRGFNPLHQAALKGNAMALAELVKRFPALADDRKDDGFSCLHLAALNGHLAATEVMLRVGARPDVPNLRGQTPLLLAVSQGHSAVAERLVIAGANVNAKDDDGDSSLHLALARQAVTGEIRDAPALLQVAVKLGSPLDQQPGAVLACFLAQHGASLSARDKQGRTPLDLCRDDKLREALLRASVVSTIAESCQLCLEATVTVTFRPCGHRVVCVLCAARMKVCISCKTPIESKLEEKPPAGDRLKELEEKLREIEEEMLCAICMENKKQIAFLCGHQACNQCAGPLKNCHICRKPVAKKICLYT